MTLCLLQRMFSCLLVNEGCCASSVSLCGYRRVPVRYACMSRGHKVWLVIFLLLLVAAGVGLYLYRSGYFVPAPVPPEEQVIAPEITSTAEIEQYTGGKAIPVADPSRTVPPIDPDDHIRGSANAEISMVEYTNVNNPYASLIHADLIKILAANDDVNWVFRQYPRTSNAADLLAAEATECVASVSGNDVFWRYLDALLVRKNFSRETLLSTGIGVGVSRTEFESCLNDGTKRDYVILDKRDAQVKGKIFVTPTFVFIDNRTGETRIAEGLNTSAYFQEIIRVMR